MEESTHSVDGESTTDEALMIAYAQGDASAFDLLYQRHKVAVYRFFVRQNISTSVAEELCHDTWLKVINARANYQVSALFKTYIFTIARNLMIDYLSKKSTQKEECTNQEMNEDKLMTDEGNIELQGRKQAIMNALKVQLNALPFEQREVFLLKQTSGFSIEQIAAITHQHKEKVKSSWRYAIQKMRAGLSAYVE